MKRFFYSLVWMVAGFIVGFSFREIQNEIREKKYRKSHKIAYATHPVIENKPFVIIVLTRDNAEVYEQNLLSILNQNYDNFRIIYIADTSDAHTDKKIESFIEHYDVNDRMTLTHRSKEMGRIESLYRAVHSCHSHEIVILLEGEDSFSNKNSLETYNRYFADPNVWMASTQEILSPTFEKIREDFFQIFYAGLFKKIKLRDFLFNGSFIQCDYEKIISPPLKELAGGHAYFIEDLLLISHRKKEIGQMQQEKTYSVMKDNPWHDFSADEEKVDMIVFSYNRPLQLYAFLESSKKYVDHLHRQFIVYRAGNQHYEKGYQKVKEAFPNAIYIRQSLENPYADFTPIVCKVLFDRDISPARYIVFALDDNLIKDTIDLEEAAKALKETGAYGFYFCLGNNLMVHPEKEQIPIGNGMIAWQFSSMSGEWAIPNSVHHMALFNKDDIHPYFLRMKFHNPQILHALWNEHADLSQVGLYYEQSKALNIPLNIVMENEWIGEQQTTISTKELLTFFEQGLKMDISPLDRIENHTIEIAYKPEFIPRE